MNFERGPRYDEYSKLREKKLRFNYQQYQQQEQQQEHQQEHQQEKRENVFESKIPTISTKQAKYQKGSSLIAQSVPEFSSLLRKENRKPVNNNMLPGGGGTATLTPPLKSKSKGCGVMSSSRGGSRSVNANGEKRKGCGGGGILTARKSYGNFDELRGFSLATANAINGESRNVRVGVGKKSVLR